MTMPPNRVLAAEDSPTQAAVLRTHLESAGFEVALAGDGAEAMTLLERQPFDIVVSDVVMPGVDGYDLCRYVKDHHADVPVVLLTSMTDPLDVVHALAAGADNFLRKPYQPDELLHRVRNMLYNKELRQSGRTQIGLELFFLGRRFMINSDREQILDLLVSTFEDLVSVNEQLRHREEDLARANDEISLRLQEVEVERERLRAVLGALPEGMAVMDAEGRIVHANQNVADLLGATPSSLLGELVWDAAHFSGPDGEPYGEAEMASLLGQRGRSVVGSGFDLFLDRSDGRRSPVLVHTAPIAGPGGSVEGTVGVIQDLAALLSHDPLTGLPGHGILVDRLRAAPVTGPAETALLVVVIDRFDRIREKLPPQSGDEIIAVVASRLRSALQSARIRQRSSTISAAYLGNGDLAVIATDLRGERDAVVVAEVLADELAGDVVTGGLEVNVTVSVAVGMATAATHPTELVAAVTASSRQASLSGGSRVASSDPGMHAGVLERLQRETELRRALGTGQLVAHYQPQVQLRHGRPVAVEALVRWQHPEHGLLGAGEIISLALEAGLIAALSWEVLEQACATARRWRDSLPGGERLLLSVNVAVEQLAEPDVVAHVEQILDRTGLDPNALILEITETSVMETSSSIGERLAGIKALGVQIAIDDFGTGYSSLLQLRHLPVDILKIDRSFVAGMIDEAADAALVAGSINLARALGLEVVAEGVETMEQLVQLRVLGCDVGQGYHWSRPVPAGELEQWWSGQPIGPSPDESPFGAVADTLGTEDDTIAYLVHELRTPLTAISGYAELLTDARPGDRIEGFVEAVARNARELESRLALVAEARDARQGGITLESEELDLAELVRTLVRDIGSQLGDHPAHVEADGAVAVSVDRSRLLQAITNLLTNAAKFSPAGSPIDVTVEACDHQAVLRVRDHGPGIPAHRRPELFRRFSRLGSRSKGMGVGLYLARLIIDAHGGHLGYEPAPDGGSIFSIRLPQALPSGSGTDQPGTAVTTGDGEGAGPGSTHPVTVLYIEDNETSSRLVDTVLSRRPGVTLHLAANGLRGVALAVEYRPDLILLDLNLPDLPGEEVLRRLRSDPRTADVKVVIASADTTPDRSRELDALGVDGIIPKPFDLARLAALVEDARTTDGRGRGGAAREPGEVPPAEEELDSAMVDALRELGAAGDGDLDGLLEAFADDARQQIDRLRAAAAAEDSAALAEAAHALAGASGNLGARVVARLCRDLEAAARSGDSADAVGTVERIAAATAHALDALERQFGSRRDADR